jgi:hypothetical protein
MTLILLIANLRSFVLEQIMMPAFLSLPDGMLAATCGSCDSKFRLGISEIFSMYSCKCFFCHPSRSPSFFFFLFPFFHFPPIISFVGSQHHLIYLGFQPSSHCSTSPPWHHPTTSVAPANLKLGRLGIHHLYFIDIRQVQAGRSD